MDSFDIWGLGQFGNSLWAVRRGMTEEQKRNHARVLNVNRRHLNKEQRNEVMRAMRADGSTYQEIAAAVGVSYGTVYEVAAGVNIKSDIENSRGQTRPATYARASAPPPTMFDPGGSADLEPRQIRYMEPRVIR